MALLQKAYLGATPLFRIDPWWIETDAVVVDRKLITDATASATPHNKGSYAEIIASTAAAANFLEFKIQNTSSLGNSAAQLIDIAVGAAGSEAVIVPDIAVGGIGGAGNDVLIQFPVSIAAGARISFRNQAEIASATCRMSQFTCYNVDSDGISTSVDVIGTDTANSQGTKLNATNGTWQEIIASTAQDYTGICLVPSTSEATQSNFTDALVELGVGAGGSEVVIGGMYVNLSANEFVAQRSFVVFFGRRIPSGSRLAVRHTITGGIGNKLDACLIAVP